MKTILIASLGNPGKKYEKTRHNAGFMFADHFWKTFHDEFSFSDWEFKKNFNAEISIGKTKNKDIGLNFLAVTKNLRSAKKNFEDIKIILLKPKTYMNLSGETVKKAMGFYKLKPENLVVTHDDIDLALGKYKFSFGSRAAGHNGVQNIIDQLRTKNFARIRIGIDNRKDKKIATEKYVLGKFTKEELKAISEVSSEILAKLVL